MVAGTVANVISVRIISSPVLFIVRFPIKKYQKIRNRGRESLTPLMRITKENGRHGTGGKQAGKLRLWVGVNIGEGKAES